MHFKRQISKCYLMYRIQQNFRGGKLSRLCTKHTIHWKTFAVHQAHAIMYCTRQMVQGENFRDWLKNRENCESFAVYGIYWSLFRFTGNPQILQYFPLCYTIQKQKNVGYVFNSYVLYIALQWKVSSFLLFALSPCKLLREYWYQVCLRWTV